MIIKYKVMECSKKENEEIFQCLTIPVWLTWNKTNGEITIIDARKNNVSKGYFSTKYYDNTTIIIDVADVKLIFGVE